MVNSLQAILLRLPSNQKLLPGILPVLGDGTAWGHLMAMMQDLSGWNLLMKAQPQIWPTLMTPAALRIAPSGALGIFYNGVDGNLTLPNPYWTLTN